MITYWAKMNFFCCCCCVLLFVTPWIAVRQAFLSITNSGACSNPCPSSQWCHPTILSSVSSSCLFLSFCHHFLVISSCPQSFPASGSFPVSQLFTSGDQSIGASASASILSMNIQDWFLLGLTGLISLLSKELSRIFSKPTVQKHPFFEAQVFFFMVQLSHPYMAPGKTIALMRQTFISKVMSLLFNMLSRLVITFLPRSKRLLISRLLSPSAVILESKKLMFFSW